MMVFFKIVVFGGIKLGVGESWKSYHNWGYDFFLMHNIIILVEVTLNCGLAIWGSIYSRVWLIGAFAQVWLCESWPTKGALSYLRYLLNVGDSWTFKYTPVLKKEKWSEVNYIPSGKWMSYVVDLWNRGITAQHCTVLDCTKRFY